MYRNRKYRSGTSSLLRASTSTNANSQQNTDESAATVGTAASSDTANSKSISRILTDQANIIPEEDENADGSPRAKILVIVSSCVCV